MVFAISKYEGNQFQATFDFPAEIHGTFDWSEFKFNSRWSGLIIFEKIVALFTEAGMPLNASEQLLLWRDFESTAGISLFEDADLVHLHSVLPASRKADFKSKKSLVKLYLKRYSEHLLEAQVYENIAAQKYNTKNILLHVGNAEPAPALNEFFEPEERSSDDYPTN